MPSKLGCGPLAAVIIAVFVILMLGVNEGVGIYFTECDEEDANFFSCFLDEMMGEEEEEESEEGTVTATGAYEYKGYSVTITANIPLAGGNVTGTVSGTCDAKVKGTYNGRPNGAITGTIAGVCSPLVVNIPSSATFTGSVNKAGKTVPFNFVGQGGGLTHEGSTTLKY